MDDTSSIGLTASGCRFIDLHTHPYPRHSSAAQQNDLPFIWASDKRQFTIPVRIFICSAYTHRLPLLSRSKSVGSPQGKPDSCVSKSITGRTQQEANPPEADYLFATSTKKAAQRCCSPARGSHSIPNSRKLLERPAIEASGGTLLDGAVA